MKNHMYNKHCETYTVKLGRSSYSKGQTVQSVTANELSGYAFTLMLHNCGIKQITQTNGPIQEVLCDIILHTLFLRIIKL